MSASSLASPWISSEGLWRDERFLAAGLRHGVTTRVLGDMKDPARREAAFAAAGLAGRPAYYVQQVHGSNIAANLKGEALAPAAVLKGCDGWVTERTDSIVCIFVADCLPLFLRARGRPFAGLFHAGWRGTLEKMALGAVLAFERHGIKPSEIEASIGPHIGPCCYRVGREVAERFDVASSREREGGFYLDLGREVRGHLLGAGVPEEAVAASPLCTSCRSDLFFSFRRDKGDSRMMAFVSLGERDGD